MTRRIRAVTTRPTPTLTLDDVRAWPPTVNIPTACPALGISRSHGFDLARRGEFPVRLIRVGNRWRVVTADLIALLDPSPTRDSA